MEHWSSNVIKFDPKIIDESSRIIEGIATAPIYDRVNELITADAIKKALPNYMKLPVVTLMHKDFALGFTQDAKINEDGSLFVRIKIKETPEVDRVWDLIKTGVLNHFSISGTRTSTTCSRANLGSPCVTDGFHLSTITICGDDAANPQAKISYIQKELFGEDSIMTEPIENPVEKTVEVQTPEINHLAPILEAIASLQKSFDEMKSKEVEDKPEVVESEFEKSINESIKTFAERFDKIESRLANIEEQKIEKGGILIDETDTPHAVGNIKLENYIINRYRHGN